MRLHYRALNQHQRPLRNGFSLVELLLTIGLGGLLTSVSADAMITHIKASEAFETKERLRQDWSRTSHFIESEIALSERVLTTPTNVSLASCDGGEDITDTQFRFALDVRRDIPQVIYYVKRNNSDQGQSLVPTSSLWRKGPGIDEDGNYTSVCDHLLIVDGLTSQADVQMDSSKSKCDLTLPSSATSVQKSLSFTLCIKGVQKRINGTQITQSQQSSTFSRISPLFSYPNNTYLCDQSDLTIEGFYRLINDQVEGDTLQVPLGQLDAKQEILICGKGEKLNIVGGYSDDVLEGFVPEGEAAGSTGYVIIGNCGNDRLRGTNGSDTLIGDRPPISSDPPDPLHSKYFTAEPYQCNTKYLVNKESIEFPTIFDTLIGNGGDDIFVGGQGDNFYLPDDGDSNTPDDGIDSIIGGDKLDVVFLDDNTTKYDASLLQECDKKSCTLRHVDRDNSTTHSIKMINIEVLIFKDGRFDLPEAK